MCDYHTLVSTLHGFAEKAKHGPLSLGEAVDSLDEAAYSFITIILVLPFMQPVPLGPLTVLGGLTFAVLGLQLLRGHESPVLPKRIRAVEMNERHWRMLVNVCLKLLGFCRKFTRTRHVWVFEGRRGHQIGGFVLVVSGLLMAIPFGVLPLNNMLPGLSILLYGIGELEQDGLMVGAAFVALAATLVYFGAFFIALWLFGNEALGYFS